MRRKERGRGEEGGGNCYMLFPWDRLFNVMTTAKIDEFDLVGVGNYYVSPIEVSVDNLFWGGEGD